MKKDIKELEDKLKTITGEDKLPRGDISEKKSKKPFKSTQFLKLAEEVKRILEDDAISPNPVIKP